MEKDRKGGKRFVFKTKPREITDRLAKILTVNKSGFPWPFRRSNTPCFPSICLRNTTQFKNNGTWTHHGYPEFRRTFTRTPSRFCRAPGDSFIWEDTNPQFSSTTYITREYTAACFQLTCRNPTWFSCLETKVTEGYRIPGQSTTFPTTTVWFSIFGSFWA